MAKPNKWTALVAAHTAAKRAAAAKPLPPIDPQAVIDAVDQKLGLPSRARRAELAAMDRTMGVDAGASSSVRVDGNRLLLGVSPSVGQPVAPVAPDALSRKMGA
jgi:hypothetical protein